MNLVEILAALNNLDMAAEIDFSMADITGELKDKVDSIKTVLARLDGEEKRLRGDAELLKAAADQVRRNAERLEKWVIHSMDSQGFKKIPGNLWSATLIRNQPSLVTDQKPTAQIAAEIPDYVKREVTWSWDKSKIKKAMADGFTFAYGRLQESFRVEFGPKKGENP